MVTMMDVSREAGVSSATVSRVLTGSAGVEPATKKLVLAAVAKLGYRPNLVARGLRRQVSQVIALIITDIENPFYTAVCRGVEDSARLAGYSVILCNADRDIEKEREYLRVVEDQNASGVIISPASARKTDISNLIDRGLPVIAVDMALAAATGSVLVDNRDAGALATEYLVGKRCKRIACITGPAENSTAQDRLDGYSRAIAAAGLPVDPDLIIYANYLEDGGYHAAKDLLDLPYRPDGLFVTNNRMTVGVLRALQERGVIIPDEINVIGFDELPWALQLHPHLSLVRQPAYRIGQEAARLLIDCLAGREPSPHMVLEAELVARDGI
ncbi:MAG: LacI family transcriptional regulator [Rhizobium sp.]|nr:LacI family transcriptional regulator [Rhizobium sp.]